MQEADRNRLKKGVRIRPNPYTRKGRSVWVITKMGRPKTSDEVEIKSEETGETKTITGHTLDSNYILVK